MNKWKKKPLLDLMCCISFIREFYFYQGKVGNLEKGCLWQSCVHVFLCTNKMIIFSQILYSVSNSSPHFTKTSDWSGVIVYFQWRILKIMFLKKNNIHT